MLTKQRTVFMSGTLFVQKAVQHRMYFRIFVIILRDFQLVISACVPVNHLEAVPGATFMELLKRSKSALLKLLNTHKNAYLKKIFTECVLDAR